MAADMDGMCAIAWQRIASKWCVIRGSCSICSGFLNLPRGFQLEMQHLIERGTFEIVPFTDDEIGRQAQSRAAVCVPLMARQLFRHSGGIVLQAMASSAVLAMLSAVSSIGRARAFHVTATTAFRCSRASRGLLSAYGGGGLASSTQLTTSSARNLRSTAAAAMSTAVSSRVDSGRGRNSKVRMVSAVRDN